jgi:tumor protein p53-inducible protein 3
LAQNAASAALDARWILFGLLGGPDAAGPLLGTLLRKRIRLQATTLRNRSMEYKVCALAATHSRVTPR